MAWISFGAWPCRKKKLNYRSRLDVVEIARRLKCFLSASVTSKDFSSAHEKPLFQRHIDSVLRHQEVDRAKDLWTPPRVSVVSNNWSRRGHGCLSLLSVVRRRVEICASGRSLGQTECACVSLNVIKGNGSLYTYSY